MKPTITATLAAAMLQAISPERGIGCGRIYVSICDKAQAKEVAKAAKTLGMIWQGRSHYGTANALYIGYDNCDGHALARGSAVVAALTAIGVRCYRDEQGD